MKSRLLMAGLVALLTVSFAARGADAPAADTTVPPEKMDKTPVGKKRFEPADRQEAPKPEPPAPYKVLPPPAEKKPAPVRRKEPRETRQE